MDTRARCMVIDAHCDTLMALCGRSMNSAEKTPRDFFMDTPGVHLDLPKLLRGGVACQVMAVFLEDNQLEHARDAAMHMLDVFDTVLTQSKGALKPVLSASDLASLSHPSEASGQVGILLSLEGAEALEGSLDNLAVFYRRGVRAIGITWNRRNQFGRGCRAEGDDGLTPLGRELVEAMQDMHMIVDVAHLSDQGFHEVAELMKGPFIASHANARSVLEHPRNLTDEQIRIIADHGGAVGCVFVPHFVTQDPAACSVEAFLGHVDAIVRAGGIASCAIGSDFDGYSTEFPGVLPDAGSYGLLYEALRQHGYSHSDCCRILGANWQRVFSDILG